MSKLIKEYNPLQNSACYSSQIVEKHLRRKSLKSRDLKIWCKASSIRSLPRLFKSLPKNLCSNKNNWDQMVTCFCSYMYWYWKSFQSTYPKLNNLGQRYFCKSMSSSFSPTKFRPWPGGQNWPYRGNHLVLHRPIQDYFIILFSQSYIQWTKSKSGNRNRPVFLHGCITTH